MHANSIVTLALLLCLAPTARATQQLSLNPKTAPKLHARNQSAPGGSLPGGPQLLPSTLALNGSDSCATPDPIAGTGVFTFDDSAATTGSEGQNETLCFAPGIDADVWFVWTAPSSGNATWSLCGGASWMDTKIEVFPGSSCPQDGTSIACNDDSCGGIESRVTFAVVSGGQYMLQLGAFPGSAGFNGVFTLSIAAAAPNDECTGAQPIAGTGTFPFDTTAASTSPQQGLACGGGVCQQDVWFDWTASSTGTCTWSLCNGASFDTLVAVYAGAGCPSAGSAIACNDDDPICGPQSSVDFPCVAGNHYMLQLGAYSTGIGTGTFTLDIALQPLIYICDPGLGGVLACPCANPPSSAGRGCDNSAGTGGASISGTGASSLANPTLSFTTAGEKPSATSILLQGSASAPAGIVFGQGVRCANGVLKRLYVKTAVAGSISAPDFGAGDLDIAARSAALGGPINAGEQRWYSVYYRDPIVLGGCSAISTFNVTNTAEVLWQQ
jgi:hypothetical protein